LLDGQSRPVVLLVENFHVVHQDIAGGKCALKSTEIVEMNVSQPCAVRPSEPVHRVFKSAPNSASAP